MLFLLLFLPKISWAQATFEIVRLPTATPETDTLFLAGSFNQWNPHHVAYAFKKGQEGRYYLTLPLEVGGIEFKITRGSWGKGETLENGEGRPNRKYAVKGGIDTVRLEIESWQDLFPNQTKKHTAGANVQILSEEFWMPQLQKRRRIWVCLPASYTTSKKRYPVLYMHDGQNLFDAFYSYSGEWGIDEAMTQLGKANGPEAIVVGIDNGGEERMNEYTPWRNPTYGGGKGAAYVDFLVQTLKPYIDSRFRTLPDRKHTGLAGSSMGGLISLYGALKYPKVFGRAGVFSPAFWVSPEIFDFVAQAKVPKEVKFYLLAGAKEGDRMVPDIQRMYQLLKEKGMKPANLAYQVHQDGEHNEWYWRREFPEVFLWLFGE